MILTTADFLNTVKRYGVVPGSQQTYLDTDLLAMGDDEVVNGIVPWVLSQREGYYISEVSYALVPGQSQYDIPVRSIGMAVCDVQYLDTAGVRHPVPVIDYDQVPTLTPIGTTAGPIPACFYFYNNKINVLPTPTASSGTLVIGYFIRPSAMVTTAAAAQVTGISGTTVTVNNLPTTFIVGATCDFIRQDGGNECTQLDNPITTAGSGSITFTNALPTSLRINDWIALSGQTPIPQIPPDFRPLLARRVITMLLAAQGDTQGFNLSQVKEQEVEKNLSKLLAPRIQGELKKIHPTWRRKA